VDENIRTWWSAAGNKPGEWLQIDLGALKTIHAVQINFAEQGVTAMNRTPEFAQRYLLEFSSDGKSWQTLVDKRANPRDVPHDYLELLKPVTARYLRLTDAGTPGGGNFSVRGLRAFGFGDGKPPAPVEQLTVDRSTEKVPEKRRSAQLSWPASSGADGYIVRFGVAPDALWNQYEIRGVTSLILHSLNATPGYWFAVDSFNENGVTEFKGRPVAAP
jgi:hypothetical protein